MTIEEQKAKAIEWFLTDGNGYYWMKDEGLSLNKITLQDMQSAMKHRGYAKEPNELYWFLVVTGVLGMIGTITITLAYRFHFGRLVDYISIPGITN